MGRSESTVKPKLSNTNAGSAALHRLAVVLACATFPLIFVGGTVTTYQAGMAVPDYPTTFGDNMFAYPISTWLAGPWNIFVEHGHRLFAVMVGYITIGLAATAWQSESRSWVRRLAYLALALVCFQGALGGARVLLNEVAVARIHGCVAPIFFALASALAVVSSRRWRSGQAREQVANAGSLQRLSLITTAMIYLQIVAGSFLRHISPGATIDAFRIPLLFHLLLAAGVFIHMLLLVVCIVRFHRQERSLVLSTALMTSLVIAQITLGIATYVLKYNWPAFMSGYDFAAGMVVERGAFWTSMITTGHVAVGALLLVTSVVSTLWSFRLYQTVVKPQSETQSTTVHRWREVPA